MGNDVTSWRMAIGVFNNRSSSISKCLIFEHPSCLMIILLILFNFKQRVASYCNIFCRFTCDSILSVDVSLVVLLLVLMSGDVAENPGPFENSHDAQNCISIAHLNIRSIRTKLDNIKDFLTDFDILCFTETHLREDIHNDFLSLDGFSNPVRLDRTAFSSGLLTYVSNKLICKRLTDLENPSTDTIWTEIKFKGTTLILCNVYRAPNTNVSFWDTFNISIEKALDICKDVIIVGDLNEDLLNPNCKHLRHLMLLNNLSNVITVPTRVTHLTATLLDPILISDSLNSLNEGTIDVPSEISDHRCTYIYLPFTTVENPNVKRKVWLYKHADFNKLNDRISNTDWSFINNNDCINYICETFTYLITKYMDECIPSKDVIIRPNDKPWYNSEIRTHSRQRDKQRTKAIRTQRTEDWTKYRHTRNKVNNLKKYAKEQYFCNMEHLIIDSNNNNPKLYWKLLKQLVKSNKSCETIPPLKTLSDNGEETYHFNDTEKANCLNDYFTSISSISEEQNSTQLPIFSSKTVNTLDNFLITESEIADIIDILNPNKSVGEDKISHKILKYTKFSIAKPLALLFNKSLTVCQFPDSWKRGVIMPLFKKGNTNLSSNYRPIALLSCVGKLMERVVYKHIYNFFVQNKLIYKLQSGFLKGHSTVHQLIDIYHQVCSGIDSGQFTCMVFCDVSKAFDRVWIKGLLFKLKQCGINGDVLKWIESYLTRRTQKVFVGSSLSESQVTSAGVPQGSVLGPLFFLIFINDIADNLLSITRIFADDTSLAFTASNIPDIEGILNHDLCVISDWSKQWLVDFNPQKTEAILFTLKKNIPYPSLVFNNTNVTFVNHHKHLGLTLSCDGKWHEHVNNIISSASKVLGMMRKIKFTINRKALGQIYVSFLRPILEYGSTVWDSCTQYEKDNLEKIQHEAARIVTGLTRSVSLRSLYGELGWISLEERRQFQKLVIAYKIKNGITPEYLNNLFPETVGSNTPYNLRNNSDYNIVYTRTELFKNSYIPSCITLWNTLPEHIRNCDTLASFKRQLTSHCFKPSIIPCFYSVGSRFLSVMHTRLRNGCSNLNNDLFLNKLKPNASCDQCGHVREDAEHYFMQCPSFTNERLRLFRATRNLHPLSVNALLKGKDGRSIEDNIFIFNQVQIYIKDTKRFDRN